jgi:hypothetical protein
LGGVAQVVQCLVNSELKPQYHQKEKGRKEESKEGRKEGKFICIKPINT